MKNKFNISKISIAPLSYFFVVLTFFLLGLLVRILFWDSTGLQDAEWWRAWMFGIDKYGLSKIYEIEKCTSNIFGALVNKSILEPPFYKRQCQTVIHFSPNNYGRNYFPIVQPQLFYVELFLTKMLSIFFALNDYKSISITNSIWTTFSALLFYFIGKELKVKNSLLVATLIIWLNPIIILSANVQLYKDMPLLFLIFFSLYCWLKNKNILSLLFWGLAVIFKPTALLLMPFYISAFSYKIIYSAIPFLLTVIFHIYNQSIVGYCVSLIAITDTMGLRGAEGIGFFKYSDVFLYLLSKINYSNQEVITYSAKIISNFLSIAILFYSTKIKISNKVSTIHFDRILSLLFMLLFFRYGIQVNHWIIFMPFALIGIINCKYSYNYLCIILIFYFVQDYSYGGIFGNERYANSLYSQSLQFFFSILICFLIVSWTRKINLLGYEK